MDIRPRTNARIYYWRRVLTVLLLFVFMTFGAEYVLLRTGQLPPIVLVAWGITAIGVLAVIGMPALKLAVHVKSWRLTSTCRVFDPEREVTPEFVIENRDCTAGALNLDGFQLRGDLVKSSETSLYTTYSSAFENATSRAIALLDIVYTRGKRLTTRQIALAFISQFRDGSEILTTNYPGAATLPYPREQRRMAFPQIQDPRELYRIHAARVDGFAPVAEQNTSLNGDLAAWAENRRLRDLRYASERGYLIAAEDEKVYRPSWKGAMLIAWKGTPVVRAIRQFLRRRRAASFIENLES
jgi:hypothetical protein